MEWPVYKRKISLSSLHTPLTHPSHTHCGISHVHRSHIPRILFFSFHFFVIQYFIYVFSRMIFSIKFSPCYIIDIYIYIHSKQRQYIGSRTYLQCEIFGMQETNARNTPLHGFCLC